jgi:hypothetical protein
MTSNKLKGLFTDRTMQQLIERYKTASGEAQQGDGCGGGDQRMVNVTYSYYCTPCMACYRVISIPVFSFVQYVMRYKKHTLCLCYNFT